MWLKNNCGLQPLKSRKRSFIAPLPYATAYGSEEIFSRESFGTTKARAPYESREGDGLITCSRSGTTLIQVGGIKGLD